MHNFYLLNNSPFLEYFVSRTIFAVIDQMQEHISPEFSPTMPKFPDFSGWMATL